MEERVIRIRKAELRNPTAAAGTLYIKSALQNPVG
jgi:hypothetical protein